MTDQAARPAPTPIKQESEAEYTARIERLAGEMNFRTEMGRLATLLLRHPERAQLFRWALAEMEYADAKYADQRDQQDDGFRSSGLEDDGYWLPYIYRYLSAARLFLRQASFDRDKRKAAARSQQQMCKAWMTTMGLIESSIRVMGPLPRPGVSSTEDVEEWA